MFANFKGRTTRSEFWYFILFHYISLFLFTLIGGLLDFSVLGTIYFIITIIPLISIAWRRVNDTGNFGLLCFVPIYNIILFCQESKKNSKPKNR
jgi:uncharacterized membrane protein YhaH (DUF805 family)